MTETTPRARLVRLEISAEIEEDETHTDAHVSTELGGRHFGGWGRARRNPADQDVPLIGEELALARAMADMAAKMLEGAEADISDLEGHDVHLSR